MIDGPAGAIINNTLPILRFSLRARSTEETQMLTLEQATARKKDLLQDPAWVERYNADGIPEFREMTRLNAVISEPSRWLSSTDDELTAFVENAVALFITQIGKRPT